MEQIKIYIYSNKTVEELIPFKAMGKEHSMKEMD